MTQRFIAPLLARPRLATVLLIAVAGSASCSSSSSTPPPGDGTGGAGGGSDAGAPGPSELPVAPGSASVPRPSGAPGNLHVLDWAGFKSALTYTLDDAQPSQIEHYADLQATGVHMTFFVTTAGAGPGSFDTTFTQAVRDGHELGNHTVHHCQANLTNCTGPLASIDAELDDCTTYITTHYGQAQVWTAASPYGDTGYDAPDATRFFLNRGVGNGTVGANDSTDAFNLPCHAAVAGETVDMFNSAIDSAHSASRWVIMLIHTVLPSAANWYAPIDISVITGSATHAQSLGDVWIDSMVNVGAYWRAQKVVSAVTPAASGSGQSWTWTLPDHFPAGRHLRVTVDGGTVSQGGTALTWDAHGYYEIALDAGALTVSP